MDNQWKKVTAEKVPDIVDVNDLEADSQALLKPGMRPEVYIHELSAAEKWPDAIKIMSRALPPREAVWWACVCARQMDGFLGEKSELAALEAAEKWVFKPTDENRLAAFKRAQESHPKSAGTMSALAVAFSGPKMLVAEDQFMDVDTALFPQMVDAAVMAAACEKQGKKIIEQFQQFLKSGEDIACGGNGQINSKINSKINSGEA